MSQVVSRWEGDTAQRSGRVMKQVLPTGAGFLQVADIANVQAVWTSDEMMKGAPLHRMR